MSSEEESHSFSADGSDEEMRKVLKPCPTDEQVLDILKQHYYEETKQGDHVKPEIAILEKLDSYDDCNYKVEVQGTVYLLKVHNGVESQDYIACMMQANGEFYKEGHMNSVIHFQNAILELLVQHNLPAPKPVKPVENRCKFRGSPVVVGSLPVVSSDHSPRDLVIRVLTWVEGKPMSSVKVYSLEVLADAGRFLGLMDKTLDHLSFNSLTGALQSYGSSAALLGRGISMASMANFSGCMKKGPDSPVRSKSMTALQFHQRSFSALPASSLQTNFVGRTLSETSPPRVPRRRTLSLDKIRAELGLDTDAFLDPSLLVAARRYHQWDGKNTCDLRQFADSIDDEKRRNMVFSILSAFKLEILDSGVGSKFRKGVLHADFNDANIILNQDLHVAGVIDFGDSVESWRVLDVSVAMAYAMVSNYGKSNQSLSAAAGVLRGYNSVYPLTPLERTHLVLLMAARLACSVTLGAYTYKQNPLNKYILLHSEPAWKSLELIWSFDENTRAEMAVAVNRLFDQACLYDDSRSKVVSCYDLVIPDPGVADLLQSVRVNTFEPKEPPKKKHKTSEQNGKIFTIVFVTGNEKKLEEVKRILQPSADDNNTLQYILMSKKVDLPELQGDPIAIAREKCTAAAGLVGGPVITEDTSLCFNALRGLPGPYIRSFLESCGLEGLHKMLSGFEDKSAYAQTVVAFSAGPGKDPIVFDGRTNGKIVPARGSLDFGWDPIFEPVEGDGKTYAEMTGPEKDAISHRSRAFHQLRDYMNRFRADVLSQMS